MYIFIYKNIFSCVRTKVLDFEITLISSNSFISGLTATPHCLVSSSDKPTDFHKITLVKLGLSSLNVLNNDCKLNIFEHHHD